MTVSSSREDIMDHVIAIITANSGKRDRYSEFKAQRAGGARRERCIEYGATVDTDARPFATVGPIPRRHRRSGRAVDHLRPWCFGTHEAYGARTKDLVATAPSTFANA